MRSVPSALTMKELSQGRPSLPTASAPSNRPKIPKSLEGSRLESGGKNSPLSAGRPKPVSRVKKLVVSGQPVVKGHDHEALAEDLRKRLGESESSAKEMKFEISGLKAENERLKSLNIELEAQKKKLADALSSAEAKIAALDRFGQAASSSKEEPSESSNVQKYIANKLNPGSKLIELKVTPSPPPPPPPPPPPNLLPRRESRIEKATALAEFYHSLAKRDAKGNGNFSSPAACSVHNSIVGELQNRSAHLLAIKADVETKGELINHLISEVRHAACNSMDDVLTFVDWVDAELSRLADERAVLKHFKWPERKADALREAAVEYRDMKQLCAEASAFADEVPLSCEAFLRKIAVLVERSERCVQRLIKLRGSSMLSYQECKIPTDWMLDSGMISMIKHASTKLAKFYIKRVLAELEFARQIERGSAQEALLSQGVRFAYRVYQFVGGLDSDTMRAFEELRSRVQWRDPREGMPGISSN